MKNAPAACLSTGLLFTYLLFSAASAWAEGSVILMTIDGPIGPATAQYITEGIEQANQSEHNVVVINLNTPGGLGSSMLDITQSILNSRAPVISFVTPKGASATSAGAFIAYASPVAAMAPATNIGAASPIPIGGDTPAPNTETNEKSSKDNQPSTQTTGQLKALEDFSARIKAMAVRNHRNAEAAVAMVLKGKSFAVEEALAKNIVNLKANDLNDLLKQLDGFEVTVENKTFTIATAGKNIIRVQPDWRDQLLDILTNPSITYLFMLLAAYGILFEFYNPGAFYPGIIGAISGLLAAYGLNLLPVNFVGLILLGLGISLLLIEASMPSYGIFGIGGGVAFILGSVFLFDTSFGFVGIPYSMIAAMGVATIGFSLLAIRMAIGSQHQKPVSGIEGMIGEQGIVTHDIDFDQWGKVRIHGVIYTAHSKEVLKKGDTIEVIAIHGIVLKVAKLNQTGEPHA